MKDRPDHETMQLISYEMLTNERTGFCTPIYTARGKNNHSFIAVPSIEGDAVSTVSAFQTVVPRVGTQVVPAHLERNVSVGDPWTDVLLLQGTVHVGSRAELIATAEPLFNDLLRTHPFTLIDLYRDAKSQHRARAIEAAHERLRTTLGVEMADRWAVETYLRGQVQTQLRRRMSDNNASLAMWERVRDLRVVHNQQGRSIRITLNQTEAELPKNDLHSFLSLNDDETLLAFLGELPGRLADLRIELGPVRPKDSLAYVPKPILIVPIGRRTLRLVSSLKRASQNDRFSVNSSWPRQLFHIAESDDLGSLSEPDLTRYSLIVAIVDEQEPYARQEQALDRLLAFSVEQDGGAVLVAPMLPQDGPSPWFGDTQRLLPFDTASRMLVLDTSFVRSPLWYGDRGQSLQRRVIDHALKSALALVSEKGTLERMISAGSRRPGTLLVLRRASGDPGHSESRWRYLSEAVSDGVSYSEPGQGVDLIDVEAKSRGNRVDTSGLYQLSLLDGSDRNFTELALAAVEKSLRRRSSTRFADSPAFLRKRYGLERPDLATVIPIHDGGVTAMPLLVTSEAPSLAALLAAHRDGLQMVRYTDEKSLKALLVENSGRPWQGRIPDEFIPLKRTGAPSREGLFHTAFQPNAYIVSHELWDDWRLHFPNHPMAEEGLEIVSTGRAGAAQQSQVALPKSLFDDPRSFESPGSDELKKVLGRPYRRLSEDAVALLDQPASTKGPNIHRWVFKDSRLPVVPRRLPEGMTVQRGWVVFDGDVYSAAVIASDLFGIWVRGHSRSSPRSWFSMHFEGELNIFPWPENFSIDKETNCVRCVSPTLELSELTNELSLPDLPLAPSNASTLQLSNEIDPDLRWRLARALLECYESPELLSEVEVLALLRERANAPLVSVRRR